MGGAEPQVTIHAEERPIQGAGKTAVVGNPRPGLTARFGVQRSEVVLPSPGSLASVLVMGLFALSLAGAGLGWQITRIWRKK